MGASHVRDIFARAKKEAPSIIFIDELDAMEKSRDGRVRIASNDEREQTLNLLLMEMDGFNSNSAVIVLIATNRADVLDSALRQPGRFDRVVMVCLLIPFGQTLQIWLMKRLCWLHNKIKKLLEKMDFIQVVERSIAGIEKKTARLLGNEKAVVARHEAGHTVVGTAVSRLLSGQRCRRLI